MRRTDAATGGQGEGSATDGWQRVAFPAAHSEKAGHCRAIESTEGPRFEAAAVASVADATLALDDVRRYLVSAESRARKGAEDPQGRWSWDIPGCRP